MAIEIEGKRILAVEVRRSCIGYATFQGPKQLLDWGATTPYPRQGVLRRTEKRLSSLLKMLPPALVVIKRPRKVSPHSEILRVIKRQASRQSIPVRLIARSEVRKAFSNFRAGNKYDIADVLTRMFPELIFQLPPKRRTGDSERHAMIVFDAIAVGVACMQRDTVPKPPPE